MGIAKPQSEGGDLASYRLYVGWSGECWLTFSGPEGWWSRTVVVMCFLAKGVSFPSIVDPLVAETLVFREAIQWCQALGFPPVMFESDAKVLIDKVNANDAQDGRVAAIMEEIVNLLAMNGGFQVRFVGRNSNKIAHSVVRKTPSLSPASCRLYEFCVWVGSQM
ncbi:unnamed protein product [Linum trigynum]|uniref:RNase H type-1 domain-containing protein n=1 Tax=Linum trigynum TaxID=586398 RepID=A0AAV2CZK1_9ROSI